MTNTSELIKRILKHKTPRFLYRYFQRIESSGIGYRMAKGTFWSFVGAVISRGINLLAFILIARMLNRQSFGELGIIQSTIGMFGVLAGFGMGLTATKHIAEYKLSDPIKAGKIIGLSYLITMCAGLMLAVALFLFSPWIATHSLAARHLSGLLKIGALLMLLSTVNGVQTASLAGFESFRMIAQVNLVGGVISFPILLSLTYFWDIKGAVWGLTSTTAISLYLNQKALTKEASRYRIFFCIRGVREEWKVFRDFSIPAGLANVLVGPVNWICYALLVNTPNGYSEMGIFNAANQWYSAILFIPGIVGGAIFPVMAEHISLNDTSRSIRILSTSIKIIFVAIIPMVIIGVILSPFIMNLYGPGYRSSWPTLIIVLLTAGLLSVMTPVGNLIAAAGKMWLGFFMNFGWGLTFVLLTWLTLHKNSFGLSLARLIAYAVHALWTGVFVFNYLSKKKK